MPKIIVEHGVALPNQKSYFHLSENLHEVLQDAGFKGVKQLYQDVHINDSKELVLKSLLGSPFYQQIWNSINLEMQESIINKFYQVFEENFEKNNEMIRFESSIAVANA